MDSGLAIVAPRNDGHGVRRSVRPWLTAAQLPSHLPHGASTSRLRNPPYRFASTFIKGGMTMGQRVRPTTAENFAPADLLQGILVVSSFGFWAVMLGLVPVLLFRVWLT